MLNTKCENLFNSAMLSTFAYRVSSVGFFLCHRQKVLRLLYYILCLQIYYFLVKMQRNKGKIIKKIILASPNNKTFPCENLCVSQICIIFADRNLKHRRE